MNKSINLLPQKSAGYSRGRRIVFILRVSALAALVILLSASVATFLLQRRFSPENLKVEENAIVSKMRSVNQKMIKYMYTQNRLTEIKPIINKRTNLDKTISEIAQNIPEGITLDGVVVSRLDLSLSLSSSSLLLSEKLLSGFTQMAENKKLFKTITLDGLSVNPAGKHTLSIRATLL